MDLEYEVAVLPGKQKSFTRELLPTMNFNHISNLTDETGIIQHAVYNTPNRKEGYCLDDNARALMLGVWATKNEINSSATRLLPVYLSFIHYMQTTDGYFRNFMSYSKETLEDRGSEDSFGRTMMALGFLINEGSSHLMVRTAREIFSRSYPRVDELISIRAIATTIIGICQVIKYSFPDDLKRNKVIELADKIVEGYYHHNSDSWHWFEPILTYDNAMIPLSLLNAYEVTQDKRYLSIAFETMEFLESKVFGDGMLRPIGNQGWHARGKKIARFDQQGIDAMAMILFYSQAFRLTRERDYLSRMYLCFRWFLGTNDLGLSLYDPSTGGCSDGLTREGINFNQGAESTLAYWISHLIVNAALDE
jgi:hypothetical protein